MTSMDIVDETAAVVERLREWVRHNGGRDSSGFSRSINVEDVADAADLLERLSREHSVFDEKDVLGNPTAPKAWFEAAQKETRNWLIPGLGEADDPWCGYPLIDALSNPGKNATVKEGIERAAELANDVVLAVWKVARLSRERGKVIEECIAEAPTDPARDVALSVAEGILRAAVRQGHDSFGVDPGFIADAIGELRKFRAAAPQHPSVPEGTYRAALDELLGACQRYDANPDSTLAISDYLEAKDYASSMLSAAPQPPSVSSEIDWKHVAKNGLAKCTPEHTWAEWVADRNAEIERLRAELEKSEQRAKTIEENALRIRSLAVKEGEGV